MDTLFAAISGIPETRKGNRLTYLLDYILLVVFTAVMSGFSSWYEMTLYAKANEEDFKKLYKRLTKKTLNSYTPSHDTLGYVFRSLVPEQFQVAFKSWLTGVYELTGQHVSINGKTMRGVKKMELESESHTVSAYAQGLRVTLDQVFISNKSNEIKAIKQLLNLLDLKGSTVTIDAIGTQKSIVKMITEKT